MTIFDDVPPSGVSEGMVSEFRFEYYTNLSEPINIYFSWNDQKRKFSLLFSLWKILRKKAQTLFQSWNLIGSSTGNSEAGVNSIFP